jgi:hypothetical protein
MNIRQEQVLRCKSWKMLLLFVPVLLLTILSMSLDFDSWRKMGWSSLGTIMGVWLFMLSLPLLMRWRYYLRLSPEGLEIHYLVGRRRFYTWHQVENFRVQEMKNPTDIPTPANLVVFDLTERAPRRSVLQKTLRFFNRYDNSLFAAFELDAQEMADLLNDWQRNHGRPISR